MKLLVSPQGGKKQRCEKGALCRLWDSHSGVVVGSGSGSGSDSGLLGFTIYLLTAIGLSPGGSTHLHKNNTQNNTNNNRTTQITTNVEECGPCFVFASFTLAFALQLRKKHGKTPVRVRKPSVRLGQTCQSTVYILPKHPHITKLTQTHTLQNPNIHTHIHTHYKTI
jgi:hypothetical protein